MIAFWVHYNKAFMKFLAKKLNKLQLCTRMTMPEKSGLTFRNFMLTPPIGPNCNFRDIVMGGDPADPAHPVYSPDPAAAGDPELLQPARQGARWMILSIRIEAELAKLKPKKKRQTQ